MLLVQNNPQQALAALKVAAQQRNSYLEARYYQGVAEEQSGDLTAAVESYHAVQQGNPDDLWTREAHSALQRLGLP